ncbi:MAG: hypothetical protein AB1656_16580 [Candidatus Omnitrophota bacterium]
MKTAEEIISEIKELSPEERRIVVDFVESQKEESFIITRYSPEDMAKLDQDQEEARQGINISPELEGDEAIAYLEKLRQR